VRMNRIAAPAELIRILSPCRVTFLKEKSRQPHTDQDQRKTLPNFPIRVSRAVRLRAQLGGAALLRNGELIRQTVELLIPERFRDEHRRDRRGFVAHPRARPTGVGVELWALRNDRTEFPVEISLSPLKTERSMLISAAVHHQPSIGVRLAHQYRRIRRMDRLASPKRPFVRNRPHTILRWVPSGT